MVKSFFKSLLSPLLRRRDPEAWSITQFVQWASTQVDDRAFLLDAGAGDCKYKKYFSHVRYESADFEDVFDKSTRGIHTFICDLTSIPRQANTYDVILCTQVLEHVPNPQAVLKEFYRVLKPGGQLFLTVPQGYGVHGAPYNFFNFTNFGMEYLLQQVGFEVVFIRPRGGIFWLQAKMCCVITGYLLRQMKPARTMLGKMTRASAVFLANILVGYIFPILLHPLDRFDRAKAWTLGYACYSRKPRG